MSRVGRAEASESRRAGGDGRSAEGQSAVGAPREAQVIIPVGAYGTRPSTLDSRPATLTLQQVEQMALANNPTLAQADAAIGVARGREAQAWLYPKNPTVGYSAADVGEDGHDGKHGVVMSQEIVRRGKLSAARAVAGQDRELAERQAEAQMLRVLNSVRILFYQTLAAKRTMEVTRELAEPAERAIQNMQAEQKVGQRAPVELLQPQVELEQVRLIEINATNTYHALWRRLAALIGRPDMAEPPVLADELKLDVGELKRRRESLDADRAAKLEHLLAQSPELVIAEAAARRAEAELERVRREADLNLTVELATRYDAASSKQIADIGLSVPLPIFNKNQGNIMAAQSELVRAERELDRVKLSLTDRFATAFGRYRSSLEQVVRYGTELDRKTIDSVLLLKGEDRQERIKSYPQLLPRAQLAAALIAEGSPDKFSYLEVLTAQRTQIQVRLSYVRALAELRESIVVLDGLLLVDNPSAGFGEVPVPGKLSGGD